MNSAQLTNWLNVRPFQPFRICTTDGTRLDIQHPDEVVALKGTALIARRGSSGVPPLPFTTISLLHVIRLEPIDTAG